MNQNGLKLLLFLTPDYVDIEHITLYMFGKASKQTLTRTYALIHRLKGLGWNIKHNDKHGNLYAISGEHYEILVNKFSNTTEWDRVSGTMQKAAKWSAKHTLSPTALSMDV